MWGRWSRTRRPASGPGATDDFDVVDEALAIVSGKMRDLERQAGIEPQGWVIVNWLAHTRPEVLLRAAGRSARHPVSSWDVISERLVAAVAAGARSPAELSKIQRDVLVPLELALLAGDGAQQLTPLQVELMVGTALSRYRSAC